MPDYYNRVDPEHRHIYKFIKTLFHAAQLTAECAIITLVSLFFLLNVKPVPMAGADPDRFPPFYVNQSNFPNDSKSQEMSF